MIHYARINNPVGFFQVEHIKGTAIRSMASEHYHDYFEVYLYLGSLMTHFIGDQNYQLETNDIILVNRYAFHKTFYPSTVKDHDRVLLMCDIKALSIMDDPAVMDQLSMLFDLRKLQFASQADRQLAVSGILRLEETFGREASPANRLRCKLQLCELLLMLVELMEQRKLSAETSTLNNPEKRVADIIGYLNENSACSIRLDALARKFFVGKYTLCHEFKKITGITVIQYINRRRLAEAGRMLRDPFKRIVDISQAAGFNSLSHFNEQFRLSFGCSPTEYRARMNP